MEQCQQAFFIANETLKNTCEFIPSHFDAEDFAYEVIRVIEGKPLFLVDHLERLSASCVRANIVLPITLSALKQQLKVLIEVNKVANGNIKIMIADKSSEHPFWMAIWFIPASYPSAEDYRDGVKTALFDWKREAPQLKIHRPAYKQAVNEAIKQQDVYELLLVNDGRITEGSRSTVIFIRGNHIITRPKELILEGVTRKKDVELCVSNSLHLIEKALEVNELPTIDAAFLTGTSPKVLPISVILGYPPLKTDHVLLHKISEIYEKLLLQYHSDFRW
jgi:branched-chain amino acid aminotransferase